MIFPTLELVGFALIYLLGVVLTSTFPSTSIWQHGAI